MQNLNPYITISNYEKLLLQFILIKFCANENLICHNIDTFKYLRYIRCFDFIIASKNIKILYQVCL